MDQAQILNAPDEQNVSKSAVVPWQAPDGSPSVDPGTYVPRSTQGVAVGSMPGTMAESAGIATPHNALVAQTREAGSYTAGGSSSSFNQDPVPGSNQFIQNNMRQTNNLEFLQQQFNIAIQTNDPRIILEASEAIFIARQETQAVKAQAEAVINHLDNKLVESQNLNAALFQEGQSLQQQSSRAAENAAISKDAVVREAKQAISLSLIHI